MAWYVLVVSLHILAACVWIGGMVFLAAAVLPVLRRPAYQAVAIPLIHATAIRFRWIGWGTLGLLITTGIAELSFRGYGWEQLRSGSVWQGSFGRVLGVKLVLVVVVLIVSAWHDIFVGPQFTRVGQEDPHSPHTRRLRRQAAWAGRVILVLSIVVVVLGVMLVRGVPQ